MINFIRNIIEDDRYSIPVAIAAFKKVLYRDRVLALLGPAGTDQAERHFGYQLGKGNKKL